MGVALVVRGATLPVVLAVQAAQLPGVLAAVVVPLPAVLAAQAGMEAPEAGAAMLRGSLLTLETRSPATAKSRTV